MGRMEESHKNTLAVILIIAAVLALSFHAQFSFCQSDEPFYLSMTQRLYQGDRLILDEWHPTQFYTPILLPFFALYGLIVPSFTGVILYFRIISVVFAGVVSLLWYLYFKKGYGIGLSLGTALILLFFSRANIVGPSYYNLCMRFAVLTFLLWANCEEKNISDRRKTVLRCFAGICIAAAVLCQPYFAIPILIGGCVFIIRRRTSKEKRSGFVAMSSGIALSAVAYIAFFLRWGGIQQYLRNLRYVIKDPQHDFSLISFLKRIIGGHYHSNSVIVMLGVACCCFWVINIWRKRKELPEKFVLLQAILVGLSIIKPLLRISVIPCYSFLGAVALSLLPSMIAASLFHNNDIAVKLYWIGIFIAIAFAFGSNTGYDAMLSGYCISALAGLLFVGKQLVDRKNTGLNGRTLRRCTAILCTVLVVLSGIQRALGFYRDSPIYRQNVRLLAGPAAGLLTNEENAKQYNAVISLLKDESIFQDKDAYILHSKCLPWAYLCRNNRAAGPTTWAMELTDSRIEQYIQTHSNTPLYVCIYNENVSSYQDCYFNNHKACNDYNQQVLEGSFFEKVNAGELLDQNEYMRVYYVK